MAGGESLSGVLVIDKPSGQSSHDVVLAARRRLGARAGHAGTLDPFATGVLPVLLGSATRLTRFLTGGEKSYDAVVRFGHDTTTDDREGVPGPAQPVPDRAAIERALPALTGRLRQVPPAFSAKSVGGVRSYDRARGGDLTPPPAVDVEVYALDLVAWEPPDATLRVRCGAGTYVRALARDLGRACGSAAHCQALRRTASGQFTLAQAVTLAVLHDEPHEALVARLVPLAALLPGWPAVTVTDRGVTALRHGRLVPAHECSATPGALDAEWVRVLGPDGALLALGGAARRFGRPGDLHARLVLG
jgi:tRNA pseudouridine55 synthase